MKLACTSCGEVVERELFAYKRVTPIEHDPHNDDERLVPCPAVLSSASRYTCIKCANAKRPPKSIFVDERQEKTTGNPYRFVRFRFDHNDKKKCYSDSWEPSETADPNTDDPNTWLHVQREKYGDSFSGAVLPSRWMFGGCPKARGHLPWLMLSDRDTSHVIDFEQHDAPRSHHASNTSTLGEDDDGDAHNIGTDSPLCDTRQGGITRRSFDRSVDGIVDKKVVAEGKRWSDTAKRCLRAIFFENEKATDVARVSGVKLSTIRSYVRDVKAELDIVGAKEKKKKADPKSTYKAGRYKPTKRRAVLETVSA